MTTLRNRPPTPPTRPRTHHVLGASAVALTVALLAGCGSSSVGSGKPAQTTQSASSSTNSLNKLVPASVRNAGVLRVATNAEYAPYEYVDSNNQLAGIDIDLAHAIAQVLGLKVDITTTKFDSIVAGIQADRYDVGMSVFTDSTSREEAADFVTYLKSKSAIIVPGSYNGPSLNSLEDLCGHHLGLTTGASNLPVLTQQSTTCVSQGKKPLKLTQFADDTTVFNAVAQSRVEAAVESDAVAVYMAGKSDGQLKVSGSGFGCVLSGIAVKKGNTEMSHAIQSAVNAIIKNGQYKSVLDKYGVTNLAVDQALINAAGHYSSTDCSAT